MNQRTGSTAYVVRPTQIRETAGGFDNPFQVFQTLPGAAAIETPVRLLPVSGWVRVRALFEADRARGRAADPRSADARLARRLQPSWPG